MHHPDNDHSLNQSGNESIRDVIDRVDPSRRRFMQGTLGTAMLTAFGGSALVGAVKEALAAPAPVGGIGFASVPPSLAPVADLIKVPAGYSVSILSAWGDPVGSTSGSPQLNPSLPQNEADQLKQDGMHHDGMHFFPFPAAGAGGISNTRGLLCCNHEYTDEGILHHDLTPGATPQTIQRVRASQASHGVSVKELRKVGGKWTVQKPSAFGRRITANTPMRMSGPAAGSDLLKSKKFDITPAGSVDTGMLNDGFTAFGTVNNCAHGYTPWGTYLTCEENWNGYFANPTGNVTGVEGLDRKFEILSGQSRYGITATGFGYRWHTVDPRWNADTNPREPHLFGWTVEIDPWNPNSVPVKRTALGRFKHEGAWPAVGADNTVAIYQGDDERNDYVYKFVCANKFNPRNRAANRDLLDTGTLYVAKFNSDGTGQWLPLVWGQNGLTAANGFADQAEVLVKTRQAADRLGATMMDRPEWIAVHPTTNEVYVTLTNNSRRGTNPPSSNTPDGNFSGASKRPPVDAANPRANNKYGHILRWRETGGNVGATTFEWDIFVECGNKADANPNFQGNINGDDFGAPDGLWFDKDGRLWIQTDQQGDAAGDWVNIGSNTMLCADPSTKEIRRFLTSPPNCEVTGVVTTPDGKTMFVNIQHPGEDWSGSFTNKSTWPDNGNNGPTTLSAAPVVKPRACTLVITRDDGGVIGANGLTIR
jgi:secreted PhoX family phosphatase